MKALLAVGRPDPGLAAGGRRALLRLVAPFMVPLALLAGVAVVEAQAAGGQDARPRPAVRPAASPSLHSRALQRASDSVLGVEVRALADAPSNQMLGELRSGSGVVIGDDGLVVTIGYLLLEADEVDLRLDNGRRVPARVVALDIASGFGLLQPLLPLDVPAAPLARTTRVGRSEALLLVTGGSDGGYSSARLAARRPYSGPWEYHVDTALFTQPPRTDHGGAGLFNARGELLGIGSLLVMETPAEYERGPGSMFVPVDLLPPIDTELRRRGSTRASHRAWLGVNCAQRPEGVRVLGVVADSPAAAAGLEEGDLIQRLDGTPVRDLASFYKRLWGGGEAEREVTLELLRDGESLSLKVHSLDRLQAMRRAIGV